MSNGFRFTLLSRQGKARRGILETPHGAVDTPAFMPVGTKATVKALDPDGIRRTGSQIILANAYHLRLRPGEELVEQLGGLHRFMNWDGPILTDSGGFQVYSLAPLRTIDDDGISFRSHIDGSRQRFTPELVVRLQERLGPDIAMVLDECPPFESERGYVERSMDLTCRWAARCRRAKQRSDQAQFGILQGGMFEDLRARCAERLCELEFEGYAIGGMSVGEPTPTMMHIMGFSADCLPEEKPRYAMGVGTIADIVESVARGVDMFDCVLPTRLARNARLLVWNGRVNVRQEQYRDDDRPVDDDCPCRTCRGYSRAYLRHLFQCGEILAAMLATEHNVTFYQRAMQRIRTSIEDGTFEALRRELGHGEFPSSKLEPLHPGSGTATPCIITDESRQYPRCS